MNLSLDLRPPFFTVIVSVIFLFTFYFESLFLYLENLALYLNSQVINYGLLIQYNAFLLNGYVDLNELVYIRFISYQDL